MSATLIQNNKSLGKLEAENPPLAEDIIRTWKTDPKIRGEFRDLTTYAAYRRADAAGRVKVRIGTGLTRIPL